MDEVCADLSPKRSAEEANGIDGIGPSQPCGILIRRGLAHGIFIPQGQHLEAALPMLRFVACWVREEPRFPQW